MKMEKNKGNIVLIGGNLFNKGAQAMTFTVVDQIRRINPNIDIYLFSGKDFKRENDDKSRYKFEIMPWSAKEKINLLLPSFFFRGRKKKHDSNQKIRKVLSSTLYIFDISGYALSSEFSTQPKKSFTRSMFYLFSIIIAKKFSVPYYILPQSMGPFKYPFFYKIILFQLMKRFLKYPTKIFVREKAGYEEVLRFTKNNVKLAKDIVLSGDKYNMGNIFHTKPDIETFTILRNSVGIVPNKKILDRLGEENFSCLYKAIIQELLSSKRTVYILRHSVEDLSICLKLKKLFTKEERVKIISDDLNCIQLEEIISKMDFLVASRYHSVVHAYKNNVPVLCIGWAVKYRELLSFFSQERYFFDVNEGLESSKIIQALKNLFKQSKEESSVIIMKRADMISDYGKKFFKKVLS